MSEDDLVIRRIWHPTLIPNPEIIAETLRAERERAHAFCMSCGKQAKLCTFLCKRCYENMRNKRRRY